MYPAIQTREVRGLERQVNKHRLNVLAALEKTHAFSAKCISHTN
jgi:hypothetical protein